MNDSTGYILMGIVIIALLIVGPWLTLWSINTLVEMGGVQGFHIPLTFKTWLAVVLLFGGILAKSSTKDK